MSDKIRVALVDDIEPIRMHYKLLFSQDEDIEVVYEAGDGVTASKELVRLTPPIDIILMDIDMETRTAGLDATKEILSHIPDAKIIMLTVMEDDDNIFKAFQLGVKDYVLKNSSPSEVISCVKDAYLNKSPIRPIIAEKIRLEFQRIRKNEERFMYCLYLVSQLTQSEIDILDLLITGYTRNQICSYRHVELSTVKSQIHNILKKFNMASIEEVIEQVKELRIFEYLHNVSKL